MAVPTRARSAGVTAADRGRAVPGVALGRQPAVRRRVLRRSCQSGRGERPAGACARPAERAVRHLAAGASSRGIMRRTARGALRAPLKTLEKVLTTSRDRGIAGSRLPGIAGSRGVLHVVDGRRSGAKQRTRE